MKKSVSVFYAILVIMQVFIALRAHAGIDLPVIAVLDGSRNMLQVDSTVTVQDSKFFNPAYNTLLIKPYRVRDRVTFKINESSLYYLQSAFSATVRLEIAATQADGTVITTDTSLTINYDSATTYRNRSSYVFLNGYQVQVKVLAVSTSAGWNVWNALMVETELQSFPVFTFSCTDNAVQAVSVDATLDSATISDTLPVSWGNVEAADQYDLEWTYIDSSALNAGRYNTGGSPDPLLIFANSSSRVTITGTSYNIPLFYDGAGTMFFRVRSVQIQPDGSRWEAHWSSEYISTGGLGHFYFKGHERALNWQVTTSYAEEGKRKTVIQYYDGSLRGRQTVTKDNTTDTTIVAETIYDYQGRPTIQVMPSPTLNTIIKYSQNFNIGLNGAYNASDFDSLDNPSDYCDLVAQPMDTSSGASQYYSPNNLQKAFGFNRFIPDAKQFPFTQVEYTQDNTGRISRQGGVGPFYQLNSGHETKYYYGSPDQHELDALFGTEAGDHSHYFKNMVRDANGQYSVSYTDMHGRTIATALAGVQPAHVDKLASNVVNSFTETLADSNSMVIKDLGIESQKGLLVPVQQDYTFVYSLDPQSLGLKGCDSTNVCYDCLYNLEIKITDDCNNNKMYFDTLLQNFKLDSIDRLCNAGGFSISFVKNLPEGSYVITKRLSISRAGSDFYRDSVFMKKNTCTFKDSLIQQQLQLLATTMTQCKPDCQSCTDSLGTYGQFYTKFMQQAGIANADTASYSGLAMQSYQEALANCNVLCNKSSETDDIQAQMLLDMTPSSGQYANPDLIQDKYSIFFSDLYNNDPGQTPRTVFNVDYPAIDTVPFYKRVTNYTDETGKPDSVYDEVTGKMVPPQELDQATFVAKFKLSWAQALLPGHPEYCKLQYYLSLNNSTLWDRRFEATDSYDSAMKYGYLNPVNHRTTAPFDKYNSTSTADADPLYTVSAFYQNALDSILQNYTENGAYASITNNPVSTTSGNKLSMWALASASVKCGQADTNATSACILRYASDDSAFTASMCGGDLDMAWRNFRQMYLDTKRELINHEISTISCPTTVSPADTTLVRLGHQPHFSDANQLIAASNAGLPANSGAAIVQAKDSLYNFYSSNCRAYAVFWFQQLSACKVYDSATVTDTIIPRLTAVCMKGSDPTHPYGASSISPDSVNTYNSFEDVINAYNSTHGITDTSNCNAYGLTSPKPYGQQVVYSNKPVFTTKPDTCDCHQITTMYQMYQAVAFHYTSFSNFLQLQYQTSVSDSVLNQLMAMCGNVSPDSNCTYLKTPIVLPPVLQCTAGSVCISCYLFDNVNNQFVQKYPGILPSASPNPLDSAQLGRNKLYENFMNYHLGFSKRAWEYLAFKAQCGSTGDSVAIGSDSTADSLIALKGQFIYQVRNSFDNTVCTDTATWRVYQNQNFSNDDYTVAQIPNNTGVPAYTVFSGGTAKLPSGYPSVNYISYIHQMDTICLTGKYTAEARIRFNGSTPDSAHRMVGFFDSRNDTLANYYFLPNNPDTTVSGNWRIAHWDMSADSAVIKINKLGLMFPNASGNTGEIDWVRLKDRNGNVVLFEDFNSFQQFASPASGYQCSGTGGSRIVCSTCQLAFQQYYNSVKHSNLAYDSIQALYAAKGITLDACPIADAGLTMCGTATPIFPAVSLDSVSNCMDSLFFAVSKGTVLYNAYTDSLQGSFDSTYRRKCLQAYRYESFTVSHLANEYHYTLYYYDQGGNLVKTIPPEGVHPIYRSTWLDSVQAARAANLSLVNSHGLPTQYRYNTLNQVVAQQNPDVTSQSLFWYDRLGRLVISQNAKQRTVSVSESDRQYSYTLYDYLGRITEVGQLSNAGTTAMSDSISRDPGLLAAWITTSAANKSMITQTVYDLPYTGWSTLNPPPLVQRNLRNRVAYSSYTIGDNPANYNHASFYTYDAHGNVDTLLQDYGNNMADVTVQNVMNAAGNEFKRMVYQYDLVSGKVNSVAYQPNKPDQFYHRYSYDAENRLIKAETSIDSAYWEADVQYWYYRHGPLARTMLGDQQVQGLDYAYTLQGWLKGINSTSLNSAVDMGADGNIGSANQFVARDAFGISLNYFTGDFVPINSLVTPFPGYSSFLDTNYRPLYNGNISSMTANIGKFSNPMFYNYTYDQLNRITRMDAFNNLDQANNKWDGITKLGDYKERVAYDANGNITNYLRNGFGANLSMDSLSYTYNRDVNGNLLNNKLDHIHDQVTGGPYTSDLKSQSSGNYTYDSIGNLIADLQGNISSITWNVYGKITQIAKTTDTVINYSYDASGNRISKSIVPSSGNTITTWYVRDASGNVMSVYQQTDSLRLTEQHLYGSSRLGLNNTSINMQAAPVAQNVLNNSRGFRDYELSNHLGNVLVTISDKKFGVPSVSNSSLIDYFTAQVVNATDYYPFGMQMPGRNYNLGGSYRYGFNGKENDNEVKGEGNQIDYGMRVYDPRAGRFLSVDPLEGKFPYYSPFQFAGNKPVWATDLDGEEELVWRPQWWELVPQLKLPKLNIPIQPTPPTPPVIPNGFSTPQAPTLPPIPHTTLPPVPSIIRTTPIDESKIDRNDANTYPPPPFEGQWKVTPLRKGTKGYDKLKNKGVSRLENEKGDVLRWHNSDKWHPKGHWDLKPGGNINNEWENYTPDGIRIPRGSIFGKDFNPIINPFSNQMLIKLLKQYDSQKQFDEKLKQYEKNKENYDKDKKDYDKKINQFAKDHPDLLT